MSNALSREERTARWNDGVSLGMAWWKYGDERQRKQQIERRGTPQAQIIEHQMMGDVFGMLASGDLFAWGHQIAPVPSDGPIPVPADVFAQRPPVTWREDIVTASGETFERITVCELTPSNSTAPTAKRPIDPVEVRVESSSKSGPKDTYELSRRVLEALEREDAVYIGFSAERLFPTFEGRFREMFQHLEGGRPSPRVRTLRDQLKRYRSERTGNNRQ